ncbi:LmeA family phospholipid-binding protein [Leptolyngbya sp. AN03gr2]|uniref:LmeA family phospholipid-binding protein n=1 Tax=unclassified Leptolyngbya TaxID=2650499 RepID=UPI003D3176A7
MPDLDDQAISKVAELGIKSQLDAVETLNVAIDIDPLKVITGALNSVSIAGEGMVMKQDLRIEQMEFNTGSVAVNPMSLAFGKIELTHPTEAEAIVTLTESDINRAFRSDFVKGKMQNLDVQVNGETATVDMQKINFGLPGAGKILFSTEVILQNSQERKSVAFTAVPKISPDKQQIVLEDVEYLDNQELSPEFTEAMLNEAKKLLDLKNFELGDMSLQLQRLAALKGKLILQSEAIVNQFPSS